MEDVMSTAYPSMLALLGLVAVAGYQHRDKIAELMSGLGGTGGSTGSSGQGAQPSGLQSVLQGARDAGGGALGFLNSGLSELVDRFKQSGRGDVAQSWVGHGPNQAIAPDELKAAIGTDALADLTRRTGLAENELLQRLSQHLPSAVDRYTPEGRIGG
jgi:uncharacterized protein YidB (DUF937 family)